ncbi:uncharacterized protein N7482_005761 [Penicillium canariense]|uniref:Spindle pole body component n=1 Tax=Penicillium canariense TaxID=189055 RepID=A0A9W9I306_9EURO|nr:uncharacterized protein N7482_005761 [Penicillium canariense]KAJ5166980.1 hypothetical protein N7482_005761 [Penicillium canariense]
MDSAEHEPDPFSSEGLWRLSKFSIEALQPLEDLPWNVDLPAIPESCFQAPFEALSKTDPIWNLNLTLNNLEPPESSTNSVIAPSIDTQSDAPSEPLQDLSDENGIWNLDSLREEPDYIAPLKTWEKYQNRASREPVSAYFTESGAKGFDAALSRQANVKGKDIAGRLVRDDVFIRSLLRLGLGWSSSFFRYNEQTMTFERYITDIRVSGVSLAVLDSVIASVLQCGTNMQRVRAFARNAPTKTKDQSSLFTLRGTVAVIIYNLEQQILIYSRNIVSVLQVMTLFQRCGEIIGALASIVDAADKAKSDSQVISVVMERGAFFTHKFGWMENLVQEIVVRVTTPWFEFIERWIGLRPEEGVLSELVASGRTFVQLEHYADPTKFKTGFERTEYRYLGGNMPSFIPKDQARSIFESGRSLRLLKRSHPYHPIARHDVLARAGDLHLHCATTWNDIERVQRRANEYESHLRNEILRYNRKQSLVQTTGTDSTRDDEPSGENLEKTFELFDIDSETVSGSVLDRKALANDKVNQLLQKARDLDPDFVDTTSRFGPELTSALYLSLAPAISSQAQLIDFSCLHHLFREHHLRHHLNLQWRFQLLGDGLFASRLTHSLFDPEMESGERKRGVVRSGVHTGLRLGSRDAWPPASSELRLVLIGLLGDCYFNEEDPEASEKTQNKRDNELPGGLSFAIRELTAEEIERCRDPNAIEALDFLRLQYKPPEALETIITPKSLKKYDRLFKHLLRLLRMVSVVKGLVRDSTNRRSLSGDIRNVFQKFRIDAQHFVLAMSDYCFHVGIGSIWDQFQKALSNIERCLDRGDINGTIEAAHSVSRLRDYHEDILDQMLFAFFLSKRHAQAAKLLDSILSTILAFSPLSRADGLSGLRHESEGTVLHLYATFRKQMAAFVGYLRSLDTGKASSKSMGKSESFFSSRTDTTSFFEHLRIRLDVRDYY